MPGRRIILSLILIMFAPNCTSSNKKEEVQLNMETIRITYITWDREFSILIGSDSVQTQKRIETSKDSSTTDKIVISSNAVNYIGSYLYENSKDSVSLNDLDSHYAIKFVLYTEIDTLRFFIQNRKSNNFLEKLINNIKASKYHSDYIPVIHYLEICDKLDKKGQN